jgi:hypothetical protein
MEVRQIRRMVPREIDDGLFEDEPPERYVRELSGYTSEWDMQQLFCKSVEAPDVAGDQRPPPRASRAGGRSRGYRGERAGHHSADAWIRLLRPPGGLGRGDALPDNYFDLGPGAERPVAVTNAARPLRPEMVRVRWR